MLNKMFANLKSKIKEETGSDVSRLTSVWGDKTKIRDSQTSTALNPSGSGDNASENECIEKLRQDIRKELDQSLNDGTSLLENKLKERDAYWKARLDELQSAVDSAQGEEVRATVAVARTAQAELAEQATKLAAAEHQLRKLRNQANCAVQVQEKLESLLEEFDSARREWSKERAELRMSLGAAEAEVGILRDELVLMRALLPPSHPEHRFDEPELGENTEDTSRLLRERAILERQLQETRVALADIKTSWSGQIASLETQVARLSLQAGEEGSERRRAVMERDLLQNQLSSMKDDVLRLKQQLVNSEAKELAKQKSVQLKVESQEIIKLQETIEENASDLLSLQSQLEDQKSGLREVNNEKESLTLLLQRSTHKYNELKRQYDILSRDKDDALLRNAHISQTLELSQCDIRNLENEIEELREKTSTVETEMTSQKKELDICLERNTLLQSSDKIQMDKIQQLEFQLEERNKSVKGLQNRILDMKKTLQRELQNSRSDIESTEDSDISRRYLKHVVMRFLTAKELEARQLTRALSVLLRLNPQEEALLQSALPPKSGISTWFGGLSTI